jgi:hypothetical protein
MGSPATEPGRHNDEPQHDVTIDRPFFLGQREVTQQEWRAVMGSNPSRFADCGPRCPAENVTFAEVQQFLAALNSQTDKALVYRLPTEAEWEYACRAGTVTPFFTGETVTTAQANFNGKETHGKSAPGMFLGPRGPAHAIVARWDARQRLGMGRRLVRPCPVGRRHRSDGPVSGEQRVVRAEAGSLGRRHAPRGAVDTIRPPATPAPVSRAADRIAPYGHELETPASSSGEEPLVMHLKALILWLSWLRRSRFVNHQGPQHGARFPQPCPPPDCRWTSRGEECWSPTANARLPEQARAGQSVHQPHARSGDGRSTRSRPAQEDDVRVFVPAGGVEFASTHADRN